MSGSPPPPLAAPEVAVDLGTATAFIVVAAVAAAAIVLTLLFIRSGPPRPAAAR